MHYFPSYTHTPIQISALNTFLRTAAKRLEINKPVSSHIFRHTHISKLAALGVPMYVIQQRVGHSNSRVTQEIYTHVTHEVLVKNRAQLENL
ncbi:integrase [Limosilactobacillus fermentum]|nr:integrase [Limosilactobacillus fermentum]